MELIVVSIGALSKNAIWKERVPVRTSHATTSLIRAGTEDAPINILVDPSLPAEILESRLGERAGIGSGDVTHVFLTNWRPVHRRGLELFSKAAWFMHGDEIDAANAVLNLAERHSAQEGHAGGETDRFVEKERALLSKVQPAPDELAEGVDLYPLFGYTPGQCGLLIAQPTLTTVITGDAVATAAHFWQGQVLGDSWDLAKAKASMSELFEVADVIVPGHDNIFVAPRAAGM